MRFDDVTIRGIDRAEARPLPDRPEVCEVPVLLSTTPPSAWKTTLREELAERDLIARETRVRDDVLLLRAPLARVDLAYRELVSTLRRTNARFRREHAEILEAQEALDRALADLDAPVPGPAPRPRTARTVPTLRSG